jgi:hypothetical protein
MGYAVVNADPRGAGNSEGRLVLWGKQDGEDGHDAIEWIAAQPWSNGKVGMFAAGRGRPPAVSDSSVGSSNCTEPAVPSLDGGN